MYQLQITNSDKATRQNLKIQVSADEALYWLCRIEALHPAFLQEKPRPEITNLEVKGE